MSGSQTDHPERTFTFRAGRRARGRSLDEYLQSRYLSLSLEFIRKRIEAGDVLLNGEIPAGSDRVLLGDTILLKLPHPPGGPLVADHDPIVILHEDEELLVLDKPPGINFQPSHRHLGGSLVNRVVGYLSREPYVLHRLDWNTSGVVLFGKCKQIVAPIHQLFRERKMDKEYLALVTGIPPATRFTVEAPIDRDPEMKNRRRIVAGGKDSTTHFEVLRTFGSQASLILARPVTGRTHQIRLHLAHKGHPVLSDSLYGSPCSFLDRHALHAQAIQFEHPQTGNQMRFEAPPPDDFQYAIQTLEKLS
ncbi:MAG: RluA family pseudouridine synthase [Planctomycetota bacterium]|nr:RluA family pseudouridine synthase [Planctomycetota bacterium]